MSKFIFSKGLINNNLFIKLNNYLLFISIAVLFFSSFNLFNNRWKNVFCYANPIKDEIGFVNEFHFFLVNGWYNSVKNGTSPIFNLFGKFFHLFVNNELFCLKYLSLFSWISLVFIWTYFIYKQVKLKKTYILFVFVLLINISLVRNVYFGAVDDPLFIVFISLTFIYLYKSINSKNNYYYSFLIGFFYALALSTRPLFIFYLLGLVLIIIYLLYLKSINIKNLFIICFTFFIVVSIIHFPSLKEKNKLSFHNKDFNKINVTYTEINYLGLLRNNDRLIYGRKQSLKPKADEILKYRLLNPKKILPKTTIASITYNYSITFRNFLGLFIIQIQSFVRQLGLTYVFFIIYTLHLLFNIKKNKFNLFYLPFIFYLCFAICLCIIPVVFMEFRWFMMFTILIPVFFIIFNNSYKLKYPILETAFYINTIIIGIANGLLIGIW